MTKLKTLKDLKAWEWINRETKVEEWVKLEELKAEAVKWVKHFRTLTLSADAEDHFIEFFNLTEEDLK